MKVIAWFRDGSFEEIPIPQKCEEYGPAYAIEKAKELSEWSEDKMATVKTWEVEEDFA